MAHDKFTTPQLIKAWENCRGHCECCGKTLSLDNQGRGMGWGAWEAHLGKGRTTPMILCTGEPENCHLNCGHSGNYQNDGVTPRKHRK